MRVVRPGGRLLLADALHTDPYAATLREASAHDVAVRPLGWRVWYGGPWFGLSIVTARKPYQLDLALNHPHRPLVCDRITRTVPRWLVFYGCFVGRGDRFGAGSRVTQVAVTRDFVDTHWVSGLV